MNGDFFFKGAVPEVALSFDVGPGPVSIGISVDIDVGIEVGKANRVFELIAILCLRLEYHS